MTMFRKVLIIAVIALFNLCYVQAAYAANSADAANHKDVSDLTPAEKEAYYDSILLDENGYKLDPEEFSTTEEFDAYYDRYKVDEGESGEPPRSISGFNTAAKKLRTLTVNQNNTYYKLHIGNFDYQDINTNISIHEKVIQDIYVRGNDIYVTQYQKPDGAVLIRHYIKGIYCQGLVEGGDPTYNYKTKMADALEMQDYMIINAAGHGTTLTAYTSPDPNDGHLYFLVCAKCKSVQHSNDPDDVDIYTLQIGRIQYQANSVYNATDVQRMCNTNYATYNALRPTGYDSLVTVIANTSRDEQYLYIRVKWNDGNKNNILHTVYDLAAFDAVLASTSATNNMGNFKTNTAIQDACVFSFDQYTSPLPNSDASAGSDSNISFNTAPSTLSQLYRYNQGLAITPYRMIYNYTGHEVLDSDNNFDESRGTYATLTRLRPTNKKVGGYRLVFNLPNSWFLNDINQSCKPTLESEGMQMVAGHFYIGVSPQNGRKNGANRRVAYIFDIPNSGLDFSK